MLNKEMKMKYKLQLGYSCDAYFSSIEKAALAMRNIVEADGGVFGMDLNDNIMPPNVMLIPVWPEKKEKGPHGKD